MQLNYNPYMPQYRFRYPNNNPYPEVNTGQLKKSARAFEPLMEDADKIIQAFVGSTPFAYNVMDAAQRSQTEVVKNYIRDIGITRPMEINFTPDSIRIQLINQVDNMEYCRLEIMLKW